MSNEQFNILMQAISELANDVQQIKQKQEEHTKILEEHTKILDEHSKILDEHTKVLNELQCSFELLVKENWQNKKDLLRIKKTIGME